MSGPGEKEEDGGTGEPHGPAESPTASVGDTQSPSVVDTQSPSVVDTQSPSVGDTQSPSVVDTQSPCVGDTQSPSVGDTQSPSVGDTQSPSVGDTQSPSVGDTQSPSVGDTQSPSVGDTQSPSVGDTQSPSVGDTQSPSVSVKIDAGCTDEPLPSSNEPGPPDTKCVDHRPEPPTPSCVCTKSDQSKGNNPDSSNEPGPPDTKSVVHRPKCPTPSCVCMKSEELRKGNTLHREGKGNGICVFTEEASTCGVCEENLTDPVPIPCGHWFCRQCITSHWDQAAPDGVHSCPQCGETFTPRPVLQEPPLPNKIVPMDVSVDKASNPKAMMCSEIFAPNPGRLTTPIRKVLTKGIAGIGKTFSVYKFTLDWAGRMANQHIDVLILMSFRELNAVKHKQFSLLSLIHEFHPTLKQVTAEQLVVMLPVFILDGLDESRFSLNFRHNEDISDVTETASVGELLTNLITGNLLPTALVWITTRPAAAIRIPVGVMDRVTEIRGFTDCQKEEYFKKRFSDQDLSTRILTHIDTSSSLHIMCHIPVFCWITATVIEDMLKTDEAGRLPETSTEMYGHFLSIRKKWKKQKYDETADINRIYSR